MIETPDKVSFSRVKRERKSTARPQRKQLALDLIHESIRVRGYPPRYTELAIGIGYSKTTSGDAYTLVSELIAEGWLKKTPGVARSLQPVKDAGAVYCEITDPALKKIARAIQDLRILR